MEHKPSPQAGVDELILERLGESGNAAGPALGERAADLVLAALISDAELTAAISAQDEPRERRVRAAADAAAEPEHAYLKAIVVEGFRGVGPQVALRLSPGPGLTVVAGRNGSGKSSFAEAAELAITGENKRWAGKTAVWRDGWRNLHCPEPARICVELSVDGKPGVTHVVREWPAGGGLDQAKAYAQAKGSPQQPVAALGWSHALELYRPFLSYSELGALLDGRPSQMHDALQSILGLDQLIEAERRLTDARKRADAQAKAAAQDLPGLLGALREHPDERARRAEAALAGKTWDLAAIEALAVGERDGDGDRVDRLRQLAAITLPAPEVIGQAAERLVAARARVAALTGTPAADARRIAGLLRSALEHHAAHPGEPCPVCRGRALDAAWADGARAEIGQLTGLAAEADAAHDELRTATSALRTATGGVPPVLHGDPGDGMDGVVNGVVDGGPARAAWEAWSALAVRGSAEQLAEQAGDRYAALASAVGMLREEAAQALQHRGEEWAPVAAALVAWAQVARSSLRAAVDLADLKRAVTWLKAAGQEIRNARLAPFAQMSAQVWETLRQESNVELGPIRLEGTANQRRVSLDVTVDGVPNAALSVMSQGELHALGLALFLPRATAQDSPFRFLIIDDPVQAMDPAKVDGLARVLEQVAAERQVIVFTHDDRLPEAIRRLQLPATIWEVVRREHSVVELRKNDDPVGRYLDDARAIAMTDDLSEQARMVVVGGFCRSAIEAACHEAVRARRLTAGVPHAEVERALAQPLTVHQMVALALFDDAEKGAGVTPALERLAGQAGTSAFHAAKKNVHGDGAHYHGGPAALATDTGKLAAALRAVH